MDPEFVAFWLGPLEQAIGSALPPTDSLQDQLWDGQQPTDINSRADSKGGSRSQQPFQSQSNIVLADITMSHTKKSRTGGPDSRLTPGSGQRL